MSQIEGQWTRQDYRREVERLLAENQRLRDALAWYDVHKRDDGSYDGEMFGDLRALAAVRVEDE